MADLQARLVAYDPNGSRRGILPQPVDWSASLVLNDLPGMQVGYATTSAGYSRISTPCEVALETSADGGNTWAEPWGGRYLRLKRGDDNTDPTGKITYECPGYAWVLRKALLYPSAFDVEGRRTLTSVTVGSIIKTLIDEAKARGALSGLTYDFTAANDSNGNAWGSTITSLTLDPGVDILTVLNSLAEQGGMDWITSGRVLRMFKPGDSAGLARNLATGQTPKVLRYGRDIMDAPDQATLEDVITDVLAIGDEGLTQQVNNASAVSPWGRWEGSVQQGGVGDTTQATAFAQATLNANAKEKIESTRELNLTGAQWLAVADYRVGDYILAPDDTGTLASQRVKAITLQGNDNGLVSGNVTLNDRLEEASLAALERINAILNGGVTGGSGTTPAPTPPAGLDTKAPAQVTGLGSATAAYIDGNGQPKAQVTLSWSAVTTNADGTAIDDLEAYEVWERQNTTGTIWRQRSTVQAGDTSVTLAPYDVNSNWLYRVRARDTTYHRGTFSSPDLSVVMANDTTPPLIPSTPTTSARLGVARIDWDGLNSSGTAMDADLAYVWVHVSSTNGFTADATTRFATLTGRGSIVIPNLPYNSTRYVRLQAVDRSGNLGTQSAQASVTVGQLVDTDFIGRVVSGANIVLNSVTASDVVIANTITGGLIQALAIATGHLQANSITAPKVAAGAINTTHLAVGAVQEDSTAGMGQNVVNDSSFEDTTFWGAVTAGTVTGMTMTASFGAATVTTVANSGARSLGLGNAIAAGSLDITPLRSVPVSRQVYYGGFARSNGAGTNAGAFTYMAITWYDSAGSGISTTTSQVGPTGTSFGWQYKEFVATAPTNAVQYRVKIGYSSQNVAQGMTYFWDDVIVYEVLSSSPTVQHTNISPAGLELFDSYGNRVITLTSTPPNYLAVYASLNSDGQGVPLGSFDSEGFLNASGLSTDSDPLIAGRPLVGDFIDADVLNENNAAGLLDRLPRGCVAYGYRSLTGASAFSVSSTETGILELPFIAVAGRMYRIRSNNFVWSNTTVSDIRIRNGGTGSPTTASPGIRTYRRQTALSAVACSITDVLRCNISGSTANGGELNAGVNRLLISLFNSGGAASIANGGDDQGLIRFWVEDIGIDTPNTAIQNNGTGGTTLYRQYTQTFFATQQAVWYGSGTLRTDTTDAIQGYGPSSGDQETFLGWGTTVSAALSGAVSVQKVELFLRANYSYLSAGGTARIGFSSSSTVPASRPTTTVSQTQFYKAPQGLWITLSNGSGWQAGTVRGVTLGPAGGTDMQYYLRFDGINATQNQPRLRVTYTK